MCVYIHIYLSIYLYTCVNTQHILTGVSIFCVYVFKENTIYGRWELLFTAQTNGKGFNSCNPLLQNPAAPGMRGELRCPGERHKTPTWAGRRPRQRQETFCFLFREWRLLSCRESPLCFYFTCILVVRLTGLMTINSFHLKVGKEKCFSPDRDNQFQEII